jgi:cyanophycinase
VAKRAKTGSPSNSGQIVIIGGHEDKVGARTILNEVAGYAKSGTLLVMTLASSEAMEQWQTYKRIFSELGVKKVEHFDLEGRADVDVERKLALFTRSSVFFFTGGDQLRITSKFGGTPYCEALRSRHNTGAVIAGTSAGASVVSETMLVSGPGDNSHRVGDTLRMTPGLGLLEGVIIDQHFAERGRIGRLIGAVTQNPRLLGLGIDENTAIVLHKKNFKVIGEGAVYVIDASHMNYSNVSETKPDVTLAAHNIKLDLLGGGDTYDLERRVAFCVERRTSAAGKGNGQTSER